MADAATLVVKRERRGVHRVTYTDGGLEGRTVRWTIHGEVPGTGRPSVETLRGVVASVPESAGVYMLWEGPIGPRR